MLQIFNSSYFSFQLHCLIGVKVIDLDVSKGNYSEILRLFLWGRNGSKNEVLYLVAYLSSYFEKTIEAL